MHFDLNVGLLSGGQTTDLGKPPSFLDRLLETTATPDNISEKSKDVQQVGLAGRIGSRQEHARPQIHVDLAEISPILQTKMGDNHDYPSDPCLVCPFTNAAYCSGVSIPSQVCSTLPTRIV